jgi:hypothetical protein
MFLDPAPSDSRPIEASVIALSTEIGRGHPSYLDSVWQVLQRRLRPHALRRTTVFETSQGRALAGWRALRGVYGRGAASRLTISLYNLVRGIPAGSASSSRVLRVLGRDLRTAFHGFPGICIVEHQMTARILSDVCRTWYVHAEVSAPAECMFPGPERVFVPIETTEQRFVDCGLEPSRIIRTGLVIEPDLVAGAHDVFQQRIEHLASGRALRVAFFTSGAYPAPHIRKIMLGVRSVLKQRMQAVVFCGTNPKFLYAMMKQVDNWRAESDVDSDPGRQSSVPPKSALTIVYRSDRRADTASAAQYLPAIDVFVAPAHERINWALGLGLPLAALFPMIGNNAQANYDFGLSRNVTFPLTTDQDARRLGPTLGQLRRDGALATMAKSGFGQFPIDGAERIAQEVVSQLPPEIVRG